MIYYFTRYYEDYQILKTGESNLTKIFIEVCCRLQAVPLLDPKQSQSDTVLVCLSDVSSRCIL